MNDNRQDKKNRKWLALVNIPVQMGIIIAAGAYLGIWLDNNYGNASTYTIIFSLLAVFIALYNVIRQVKNLDKS
jgi:F0F1-type ATP synthase assembly protein I